MDIGLIVSSNNAYGYETIDLTNAIKNARCNPLMIHVDKIVVKIKKGNTIPYQLTEFTSDKIIDHECAVLRNIGIIKDYEQFAQRIWAVRSIEKNGTVVSNPIHSWIRAGDKLGTLLKLAEHGLPVPDTISGESFFAGYNAVKEFKHAVVKPLRGGKGLGIFKVDDPDIAMHVFSYFTNLSKPIYVQKFLTKKNGGDYRIIVVGGRVIGAEFRKGKDWKSNIAQGATARAVKPNVEISELAIKAAEAMKLDYAGVDIADTKEGYYILETNPSIAWGAFKQVTKVNPAKHIIKHLISKAKA